MSTATVTDCTTALLPRRAWTPEEDALLTSLRPSHVVEEIQAKLLAAGFSRTTNAIRKRCLDLGLHATRELLLEISRRGGRSHSGKMYGASGRGLVSQVLGWSPEEETLIRKGRSCGATVEKIRRVLLKNGHVRTGPSIAKHIVNMGLTKKSTFVNEERPVTRSNYAQLAAAEKLPNEMKGRIAEAAVAFRLQFHGFDVFTPAHEGSKIDFLVGHRNHVGYCIIKVKWIDKNKSINLRFGFKDKKVYSTKDIDVVVGYDLHDDKAYVYLLKDIPKGKQSICVKRPYKFTEERFDKVLLMLALVA